MNKPALPHSSNGLEHRYAVAVASVAGREHRRLGRGNQDAVAVHLSSGPLVLALADGCSSGARSEVGAELSVRWLTEQVPALCRSGALGLGSALAESACEGLARYLETVARGLCADPAGVVRQTAEVLLATVLVAIVGDDEAVVFGVGDGIVLVNGEQRSLGEGPERAPAYPAYRGLAEEAFEGARPECGPRVHWAGPAGALESLVLGTDGAHDLRRAAGASLPDGRVWGGLEELVDEPRYVLNPSLAQKRLRVLGELPGLLPDDTTVAVLRRRHAAEEGV
jgi:hypothetical protein